MEFNEFFVYVPEFTQSSLKDLIYFKENYYYRGISNGDYIVKFEPLDVINARNLVKIEFLHKTISLGSEVLLAFVFKGKIISLEKLQVFRSLQRINKIVFFEKLNDLEKVDFLLKIHETYPAFITFHAFTEKIKKERIRLTPNIEFHFSKNQLLDILKINYKIEIAIKLFTCYSYNENNKFNLNLLEALKSTETPHSVSFSEIDFCIFKYDRTISKIEQEIISLLLPKNEIKEIELNELTAGESYRFRYILYLNSTYVNYEKEGYDFNTESTKLKLYNG